MLASTNGAVVQVPSANVNVNVGFADGVSRALVVIVIDPRLSTPVTAEQVAFAPQPDPTATLAVVKAVPPGNLGRPVGPIEARTTPLEFSHLVRSPI